jgi:hypothetical protein
VSTSIATDATTSPADQTPDPFASVDERSRKQLAELEASGLLAFDSEGRIPMLLSLPGDLNSLKRRVLSAGTAGELSGVVTVFGVEEGSGGPLFEDVSGGVGVSFFVNVASEDIRDQLEQSGLRAVSIGSTTAWVGADVKADCGPVPDDGYDQSVLTWIDGGLLLNVQVRPVPECEKSPISLDQVVTIANGLLVCKGFDLPKPDCRPLYT